MGNVSRLTASLGVVGVALLLLMTWSARSPAAGADGPVYTVATLNAVLAIHSAAWINRTLQVRARPEACLLGMDGPGSPCWEQHPVLVDAGPGQPTAALPLVRGHASPLVAILRRLPQVGRLVSAPQVVRWEAVATYRVQVHVAAASCATPPCYQALLLDAAP